ncbi:SCF ubiquitin ligase SKP1 component, partial [Trifolium medium]|nr:SCF ubiquitin ligase SKP1 component [Trifolium medium]
KVVKIVFLIVRSHDIVIPQRCSYADRAFWARLPSKQINLISSDGVTFEVDYDVAVALMSHRSKDITTETTSVGKLSTKMMIMMIEYCKAHKCLAERTWRKVDDLIKGKTPERIFS